MTSGMKTWLVVNSVLFVAINVLSYVIIAIYTNSFWVPFKIFVYPVGLFFTPTPRLIFAFICVILWIAIASISDPDNTLIIFLFSLFICVIVIFIALPTSSSDISIPVLRDIWVSFLGIPLVNGIMDYEF